jgi:hypothetical protein
VGLGLAAQVAFQDVPGDLRGHDPAPEICSGPPLPASSSKPNGVRQGRYVVPRTHAPNPTGQLTPPGAGSHGPITVCAVIGRSRPRAPGSQVRHQIQRGPGLSGQSAARSRSEGAVGGGRFPGRWPRPAETGWSDRPGSVRELYVDPKSPRSAGLAAPVPAATSGRLSPSGPRVGRSRGW